MKKTLGFFLLLFILSILKAHAGDSLKVFRRTGIYGVIGGGSYIHRNINLEHFFVNSKYFHLGARCAYGKWAAWGTKGNDGILTLSGLAGKKYHFAELQLGSLLFINRSTKTVAANNNKPTQDYYFMYGIGYTLRLRNLLLKGSIEMAPEPAITTINAAMGFIF